MNRPAAQPDLPFPARSRVSPEERRAQVVAYRARRAEAALGRLADALRGRGWVRAAALARDGFSERELREIAEHDRSGIILSYPGSPGYCLYDESSPADRARASAALRSQARQMLRRFVRYSRRASIALLP
jgi:hypothetical protein